MVGWSFLNHVHSHGLSLDCGGSFVGSTKIYLRNIQLALDNYKPSVGVNHYIENYGSEIIITLVT